MRPGLVVLTVSLALGAAAPADATWSIVAVDPATREVGVAGASCFQRVEVIGGLVPGRGAVAAQALSNLAGRAHAVARLGEGRGPRAILDEIATEVWDPTPWHTIGGASRRQYAIASLDGPSQETFTGEGTPGWSGGATAPGVAVTGNVLIGEAVVQESLARFVAPAPEACEPDLADRLVGALLAGAEAGGDRRCVPELGALSAFVAVAGPEDPPGAPSLRIVVPYEGANELWFVLLRGFWPKRGTADENPVRRLVDVYRAQRPEACLPATMP